MKALELSVCTSSVWVFNFSPPPQKSVRISKGTFAQKLRPKQWKHRYYFKVDLSIFLKHDFKNIHK